MTILFFCEWARVVKKCEFQVARKDRRETDMQMEMCAGEATVARKRMNRRSVGVILAAGKKRRVWICVLVVCLPGAVIWVAGAMAWAREHM